MILNPRGEQSINFSEPQAVMALNEALLKAYYGLDFWQIPTGYLCPPIPGRVDYIHHLADLCPASWQQQNRSVSALDIGTGANCIYPILGNRCYGWQFVASDIDPVSIKTAQSLVKSNKVLQGKIKLRQQNHRQAIFHGIIQPQDKFMLTLCNPPFHASMKEATQGSLRKVNNLNKGNNKLKTLAKTKPVLNFAGTENELCCPGGEIAFLKQMANESQDFAHQVGWFSSLVSKHENVVPMQQQLKKLGAKQIKVVPMAQGQKISRFIAWSFYTPQQLTEF